jgi:DNA-binding transcriptional regulator YdaS (Cro superfamily)
MDTLRAYLNSLSSDDQDRFARACGTSIGYLRKAISAKTEFRAALCICIERESGGAVRCDHLIPAADWAHLRGAPEVEVLQ